MNFDSTPLMPLKARYLILLGTLLASACSGGDDPAAGVSSRVNEAPESQVQSTAVAEVDGLGEGTSPMDEYSAGPPPQPATDVAGSTAAGSAARGAEEQPGALDREVAQAPQPAGETGGANDILQRAERAYAQVRSMQADFTQQVYVPLLETTQRSRGTIYHRSPDRFLMRFSDPEGDVIVADGSYVWMYYPSTDDGQVMRAPLSTSGQQADLYREFLSDATERYSATRTGADMAGGRPAQALTLVPRGASPYTRVRIWVDDQDSLVRRFEITEENGTVRNIEMTGLRSNVTLPDSLFEFTPPPNVQIHDF